LQLTRLCLALDGFTLRYAAGLVLNSTVSSQIVYLCHNWCCFSADIFSNCSSLWISWIFLSVDGPPNINFFTH